MNLKKTTKVLFCQLPKGTSSTTLKRQNGDTLKDVDILEIFEDSVSEPFLPYILFQLGMLKKVTIANEGNLPKTVYVVTGIKKYSDIDAAVIERVVRENVDVDNADIIGEVVTTIIGIQYLIKSKKRFEFDVVMIEGNSLEELKAEKKAAAKPVNTNDDCSPDGE